MRPVRNLLVGIAALLGLWIGWGAYVSRTTERVPSESLERIDDVEIRRYPRTVLAETTAPDVGTAFRRLFRYISGANARSEDVGMTAPVAIRAARGASIPMTAPVRTSVGGSRIDGDDDGDGGDGDITMAFYLPQSYAPETAPMPTDPTVRLVVEPPRTVAVRRFSWYATSERVDRERARLLERLSREDLEPRGDPTLLQYNDPWTPPFMRTNEIEVELEDVPDRLRSEAP